ncbi:hypothetical protein Krac_8796 [Ktedonobacter racemifer DSM 44963]|uniref:Uncharacterized protein n=1 Tax=Ktedonobacter racemifer DSM 44963 TaxID=485913 RepID=D6TPA6_KTERA|nr:hypothetical protein Krac_8796 [Ktedonobacter racemifer DSM 44963]
MVVRKYCKHPPWSKDGERKYREHPPWSKDGERKYCEHPPWSKDGERKYRKHLPWSKDGGVKIPQVFSHHHLYPPRATQWREVQSRHIFAIFVR